MIKEFKEFAIKGNVVDMAIGIIIGGAFSGIVSSFVDDIIMPIVGFFTGGLDFTDYFFSLDGSHYDTLTKAEEAGAATINYGQFLGIVLNFLIVAFSIFLAIKWINSLRKSEEVVEEEEATMKNCPYCKTEIPIGASRCPHCTSQLS